MEWYLSGLFKGHLNDQVQELLISSLIISTRQGLTRHRITRSKPTKKAERRVGLTCCILGSSCPETMSGSNTVRGRGLNNGNLRWVRRFSNNSKRKCKLNRLAILFNSKVLLLLRFKERRGGRNQIWEKLKKANKMLLKMQTSEDMSLWKTSSNTCNCERLPRNLQLTKMLEIGWTRAT